LDRTEPAAVRSAGPAGAGADAGSVSSAEPEICAAAGAPRRAFPAAPGETKRLPIKEKKTLDREACRC